MIFLTATTIAVFCPRCGNVTMQDISRFAFPRGGQMELFCQCGQILSTVTCANFHRYVVDVPCQVCESRHIVNVSGDDFNSGKVKTIHCGEENIELGLIGPRNTVEKVLTAQRREMDKLLKQPGNDEEDYIADPQIMFEVLNIIDDIAEKGGVYCSCGNTIITTVILADCIELRCSHCGSTTVIGANSECDLRRARAMNTIHLTATSRLGNNNE